METAVTTTLTPRIEGVNPLITGEYVDIDSPLYILEKDATRRAHQLISGRCYFTGRWYRDYWIHILNWHPLISCFACDPVNPYTKRERIAVLVSMTVLSALPTAGILDLMKNGSNLGYWSQKLLILMYITLPVLVLQYVIEYLIFFRAVFAYKDATSTRMGCCWRCLSVCMACWKGCCLCVSLYFSFFFVCFAGDLWMYHRSEVNAAVSPLLVSRLEFWLIWFLTDLYLPCCGFVAWWRKEKLDEEKRLEQLLQSLAAREEPEQQLPFAGGRLQFMSNFFQCVICCKTSSDVSSGMEWFWISIGDCRKRVVELLRYYCGRCCCCWGADRAESEDLQFSFPRRIGRRVLLYCSELRTRFDWFPCGSSSDGEVSSPSMCQRIGSECRSLFAWSREWRCACCRSREGFDCQASVLRRAVTWLCWPCARLRECCSRQREAAEGPSSDRLEDSATHEPTISYTRMDEP